MQDKENNQEQPEDNENANMSIFEIMEKADEFSEKNNQSDVGKDIVNNFEQENDKEEVGKEDKKESAPENKKEVKKDQESKKPQEKNEHTEEDEKFQSVKNDLKNSENARKKIRDEYSKACIKLKAYEKRIASLMDQGKIDKDTAESMVSEVHHDEPEYDESELSDVQKVLAVGNKGLDILRGRMSEDGDDIENTMFDKHIECFDHFMNNASLEEKINTLKELESLKSKPVALARKMLEIGEGFYDDVLSEIEESGGIKNFKAKQSKENEKLKKEIDKLNKELLKYKNEQEDYIPPKKMGIPSGGSSATHSVEDYSIAAILAQ